MQKLFLNYVSFKGKILPGLVSPAFCRAGLNSDLQIPASEAAGKVGSVLHTFLTLAQCRHCLWLNWAGWGHLDAPGSCRWTHFTFQYLSQAFWVHDLTDPQWESCSDWKIRIHKQHSEYRTSGLTAGDILRNSHCPLFHKHSNAFNTEGRRMR